MTEAINAAVNQLVVDTIATERQRISDALSPFIADGVVSLSLQQLSDVLQDVQTPVEADSPVFGITCPQCHAGVGEQCIGIVGQHASRWGLVGGEL